MTCLHSKVGWYKAIRSLHKTVTHNQLEYQCCHSQNTCIVYFQFGSNPVISTTLSLYTEVIRTGASAVYNKQYFPEDFLEVYFSCCQTNPSECPAP